MGWRLLLFGGTFDPIHHGHLIVARAVAEQLGGQRVTFVPASAPPHKLGPSGPPRPGREAPRASPQERLEMVRLAIAGEKLFDVSDLELGGQAPSYTFDTLTAFRRQLGPEVELCCLIGADMLDDLPNWHRAREVVDLARIVTVVRLPHSTHSDSTWAKIGQAFSPEQVRRLKEGLLGTPTVEISSSDIRQRVRDGRSIMYLTPDSIIDYIKRLGLYRRP